MKMIKSHLNEGIDILPKLNSLFLNIPWPKPKILIIGDFRFTEELSLFDFFTLLGAECTCLDKALFNKRLEQAFDLLVTNQPANPCFYLKHHENFISC